MGPPIKRDPRLVPLSHDHHTALARARDVTLALDGTVEQDLDALAARLSDFFENDLIRHFEQEEKYLLPPFIARVGADHKLVQQVQREHAAIRAHAARLKDASLPVAERLQAWGTAIRDHVRFEERELFAAMQQELSEDELTVIGEQLAREGPACPA